MDKMLFLYLDFLGFRDLIELPPTIRKLFSVLDSCNIHEDSAYRTIVFSDTLLAYNTAPGISRSPYSSELMMLIEFVQDITHRLTGSGIFFRALIQYGEFEHERLENIDAYFGKALISCYDHESKLKGSGLFIQSSLIPYDKVFKSVPFSSEYHFSFLAYDLIRATVWGGEYPLPEEVIGWREASIEDRVLSQVDYLRAIWEATFHAKPAVRSIYLNTWAMYEQNYGDLTAVLKNSNFNPAALCDIDWNPARESLNESKQWWQQ